MINNDKYLFIFLHTCGLLHTNLIWCFKFVMSVVSGPAPLVAFFVASRQLFDFYCEVLVHV